MARYVAPGAWQCPLCNRTLPESDFATDGYRVRMKKGPGRCRDCDREVARARSSLAADQKLSSCVDNAAAYDMAREVCAAHAWGRGYYSQTMKAAAVERADRRLKGQNQEGIRGLTTGERRAAEAVMVEGAERRQVEELRDLDRRAAERSPVGGTEPVTQADSDRKAAVRAARAARRNPDWEPEKFGG